MKTKLVIFGITGDLAKRKLVPALKKIITTGVLRDVEIVGISRNEVDIQKIVGSELAPLSTSCSFDLASPDAYKVLKQQVRLRPRDQLVVYLSVPPMAAARIIQNLGLAGLNTPNVKLLLEKPFGLDLVSAQEMNTRIEAFFSDSQVYRIDHYLAKEMAQNIIAFRSGNAMLRGIWNRQTIECIEIVACETVGVEGRANFYEQVGALRDVVQGHLMQLLALILMDTPSRLDWDQLPALRQQALSRLLPADPSKTTRAQYDGYATEVENPGSLVETFVAVELYSDSSVWEGVPLRLITGKAMSKKTTEIKVHFRAAHDEQSNCLRFKIQPDEGIEIDLYTKKPGYDRVFEMQKLQFRYPDDEVLPDAYEQVIVDAVLSRKSLFPDSDEIIESWRVLQPLLDAWSRNATKLLVYKRGARYDEVVSR